MGARLLLCLILCLAAGCAPLEPIKGCTLAAANRREVLRAQAYLHRAIPARILSVRFAGSMAGHSALVYRLDPEGWYVYDDTCGSRRLRLPDTSEFPDPLAAARAAFPVGVVAARWHEPATLTPGQGR